MANFRLDYNKLSLDRWDVRIIDEDGMKPINTTIENYESNAPHNNTQLPQYNQPHQLSSIT